MGEVPRLTTYALQDTHIHLAFTLDSEYIHKKEKGGKKGEAGEGGREGEGVLHLEIYTLLDTHNYTTFHVFD